MGCFPVRFPSSLGRAGVSQSLLASAPTAGLPCHKPCPPVLRGGGALVRGPSGLPACDVCSYTCQELRQLLSVLPHAMQTARRGNTCPLDIQVQQDSSSTPQVPPPSKHPLPGPLTPKQQPPRSCRSEQGPGRQYLHIVCHLPSPVPGQCSEPTLQMGSTSQASVGDSHR